MSAHHFDPRTGEDEFALAEAEASGVTEGVTKTRSARSRASEVNPNDPTTWGKVPRNALCPCGSGKKFKHCHGAFQPR